MQVVPSKYSSKCLYTYHDFVAPPDQIHRSDSNCLDIVQNVAINYAFENACYSEQYAIG